MYTHEDQKLFDSFRDQLRAQIHAEYEQQLKDQAEEITQMKIDLSELDSLKTEAWQAKSRYENALSNAKVEALHAVKKVKAEELLAIIGTSKYTVESRFVYGEKCDKCDENRQLKYELPRGSIAFESCECSDKHREHYVEECIVAEIELNTRHNTKVWYISRDGYDKTVSGTMIYSAKGVDPDTIIENIRRIGFDTFEHAEEYAKIMDQLDTKRKTV